MNQAVQNYINNVEKYARKKFKNRDEIGILIEIADEKHLQSEFE